MSTSWFIFEVCSKRTILKGLSYLICRISEQVHDFARYDHLPSFFFFDILLYHFYSGVVYHAEQAACWNVIKVFAIRRAKAF